jgi:hypothetical protein
MWVGGWVLDVGGVILDCGTACHPRCEVFLPDACASKDDARGERDGDRRPSALALVATLFTSTRARSSSQPALPVPGVLAALPGPTSATSTTAPTTTVTGASPSAVVATPVRGAAGAEVGAVTRTASEGAAMADDVPAHPKPVSDSVRLPLVTPQPGGPPATTTAKADPRVRRRAAARPP